MMTKTLFLAIFLIFSGCGLFSGIRQFNHPEGVRYSKSNEGKPLSLIRKTEYFLVTNFKNNEAAIKEIISFVQTEKDTNCLRYQYYSMLFFKESKYTNEFHLSNVPRDYERISIPEDLFLKFFWQNGKFVRMDRIKDGFEVRDNAGTVEVLDFPKVNSSRN